MKRAVIAGLLFATCAIAQNPPSGGAPISGATTGAIVTAASSTTLQTPSANATLDASGNEAVTSITLGGATPTVSGADYYKGVTSGGVAVAVSDIAGTAITYVWPSTNGTAGQYLIDSGVGTCPTLAVGFPSTCHIFKWVSVNVQQPFGSIGNGLAYTFTGATYGSGFVAPNSGTYQHINYDVEIADNTTHAYNMGIYNAAGTLLCSSGSVPGTTFAPATGFTTLAMTSGCVLQAGSVYFVAYTPITSGTAQLAAVNGLSVTPFAFAQVSASALPSTITAPTLSYTTGSISNNMMFFSLMP